MSAILIIYIYAGMLAKGDSVAITHVPMPSIAVCEREAKKIPKLVQGTVKDVVTLCISTQN